MTRCSNVVVGAQFSLPTVFKAEEARLLISRFVSRMLSQVGVARVLLAVDSKKDHAGVLAHPSFADGVLGEYRESGALDIYAVDSWTTSVVMNSFLLRAAGDFFGGKLFLSSALDVNPAKDDVGLMLEHLDRRTAVVGMTQRLHRFEPGMVRSLDVHQVPWNRFALWNTAMLMSTGFASVEDVLAWNNGSLEAVTIAHLQQRYGPSEAMAKLLGPSRLHLMSRHDAFSKDRVVAQASLLNQLTQSSLDAFQLRAPVVAHVGER